MIQSFADEPTRRVWDREQVRHFGHDLQRMAQKKLRLLNAAETINDLRIPPGNRLEKLSGDREGQHSIRITTNFESASSGRPPAQVTCRSSTTAEQEPR